MSSFAGGWSGAAKALGEMADAQMEQERQLELMRYQHQLEMEKIDRQAGIDRTHQNYEISINNVVRNNIKPLHSIKNLSITNAFNCVVTLPQGNKQVNGMCLEYSANINNTGIQNYRSYLVGNLIYWDTRNPTAQNSHTPSNERAKLIRAHPDWKVIVESPDFHAWMGEQPQFIQDKIHSESAKEKIELLTLYKYTRETIPLDPEHESTEFAQAHPDWKSIVGSPEFRVWMEKQPQFIQDKIKSPRAKEQIELLSIYKSNKPK